MKKITCFIESLAPGGAQHQLIILADILVHRGYDVTLTTYADVKDHFIVPATIKRVKIRACKLPGKYLNAFVKWIYVFWYLVTVKTDCVISYRQRCNARLLIPMFFRGSRVKVICSERNFTIKPTLYEKLLFDLLYYRADYIVPNSFAQAKYIIKKKPQFAEKTCTIHNYTDIDKFQISNIPDDKKVIKIAVFGRYDPQKNPLMLAEALSGLKTKTNQRFEVHWYGGQSNSDYFYLVEEKIKELRIEDVFILHDVVKTPSMFMNNYHAVCLPSLYEGFSNSIGEAICCGKPMLVSDVSDNSVMVKDGVNGYLFEPLDLNSIIEAFLKFFNLSSEEMTEMAKQSRIIAERLFDKEIFIEHYIKLIES